MRATVNWLSGNFDFIYKNSKNAMEIKINLISFKEDLAVLIFSFKYMLNVLGLYPTDTSKKCIYFNVHLI